MDGKRLLPVFIYKILRQYSSKQHPLSHAEIMKYLALDYGVEHIDPKTITRCMDDFEVAGWAVHRNKRLGVYLEEVFTETELKVLMAPMYMASYLSEKNIDKLMDKIGKINEMQRKQVNKNKALAKQYRHQEYDDFLGKIEVIDYAQDHHLQLQFIYNDMNEQGKLVPRAIGDGEIKRVVHPLGMVCVNNFYYFVGAKGDELKVLNYRIDKMTHVVVLDDKAVPISKIPGYEKGVFCPSEYVNKNFRMYNTVPENVKFRLVVDEPKRLNLYINTIWDEFGNRLDRVKKVDDRTIEFSVKIPLLGAKIFAMQYANVAEVLEPQELRDELRKAFMESVKRYN